MSIPEDLKNDYLQLKALPLSADRVDKQKRGYDFERLLVKLFTLDGLEPRTSYRPTGEQIDGSIYLDGRIYLLEAKWHAKPLPASTLYQFKGKVDGKLAGTLGIFISMSGYSENVVDALTLGKVLNVLLLDHDDMDAAIQDGHGIKEILKLRVRKAAEEGIVYFPVAAELVTARESQVIEILDSIPRSSFSKLVAKHRPADLFIVCEGEVDRVIISTLATRILASARSARSIQILTAKGKLSIPGVTNALRKIFPSDSRVLIVTDGDHDPTGTFSMLADGLEFAKWEVAIPDPSIERWLGTDVETLRCQGPHYRIKQSQQLAQELDIEALRLNDKEFKRFYEAILGR